MSEHNHIVLADTMSFAARSGKHIINHIYALIVGKVLSHEQ